MWCLDGGAWRVATRTCQPEWGWTGSSTLNSRQPDHSDSLSLSGRYLDDGTIPGRPGAAGAGDGGGWDSNQPVQAEWSIGIYFDWPGPKWASWRQEGEWSCPDRVEAGVIIESWPWQDWIQLEQHRYPEAPVRDKLGDGTLIEWRRK